MFRLNGHFKVARNYSSRQTVNNTQSHYNAHMCITYNHQLRNIRIWLVIPVVPVGEIFINPSFMGILKIYTIFLEEIKRKKEKSSFYNTIV